MKKTNDSPQLKAVLQHQQAIDAASEKARVLEVAIAECDQKIQAAREGCPSDAGFEKQLEDLAAAAATGQITEAEARKREQEIAGKRDPVRQQAGEVGKEIERIERARKGLQRLLGEARSEESELSVRKPEVLQAFLLSEAEAVCAAYVEAGREVKTAWLQLIALQWMLQRHSNVTILADHVRLPVVNLPQCDGLATELRTHGMMWFDPESVVMGPTINEGKEQEFSRIRALGVVLD